MDESPLTIGTRKQKVLFKCITHDATPVLVAGNTEELGDWNVDGGLAMNSQPRPQGGFEWTGQIELPLGHTIEYKFLKKDGQGHRWESGNNLRITVIPALHTLDSDFRE